MGVVSNKINIMELQKSGGGGGDPTIPGRVSALENEMTGVYASINQISTVELPKVYSSISEISTVELPKIYSSISEISTVELPKVYASINANTQAILTGSVNMADKVKMNNNNPIRFGVDGDGNYGYIKAGADTVTPFLTGGGSVNTKESSINSASPSTSQLNFTNITNKPLFFVVFPNVNFSYTSTSNPCAVIIAGIYRPTTDDYIIWYGYGVTHSTSSANYSANNYSYLTAVYDSANSKMTISSSDTTKILFPNVVTKWKMWYAY